MIALRARLLAAVSLLLLIYAALMTYYTSPARFEKHGETLYLQLVCLETARLSTDADDLLRRYELGTNEDQIEQYRASTRWDDGFLFLYPLQLIVLCGFTWGTGSNRYAVIAMVLIVFGGLCDWQENQKIFEVLGQASQGHHHVDQSVVNELRNWSLWKWGLDGAAWRIAAIALANSTSTALHNVGRWRLRFVAANLFFAGIMSLLGALTFLWSTDWRLLLEAGVLLDGLSVAGCTFAFWPRPQETFP